MNMRGLRLFMTVAEHGSISAAAEALGMAQPLLSRQIRALESELGAKVFDRHSRGVQPNGNGRILMQATRSIDANYRSALRDLSEAQAMTGHIRVGATPSWFRRILPETAAHLTADYPAARITMTRQPADSLLNALPKGDLDLILLPRDATRNHASLLSTETLLQARYTVFGATHHPDLSAGVVTLEEVAARQWVLPRRSDARTRFAAIFQAAGLTPPDPVLEVDEAAAIRDIVAESEMLSYGSLDPGLSGLAEIDCPPLTTRVDQCCATVRGAARTPLSRLFLEVLRTKVVPSAEA